MAPQYVRWRGPGIRDHAGISCRDARHRPPECQPGRRTNAESRGHSVHPGSGEDRRSPGAGASFVRVLRERPAHSPRSGAGVVRGYRALPETKYQLLPPPSAAPAAVFTRLRSEAKGRVTRSQACGATQPKLITEASAELFVRSTCTRAGKHLSWRW